LQVIIILLQGALVFVSWRLVESANKQAEAASQSVTAIEKTINISEQSMKIANRAYIATSFPQKIDITSNFEIKIQITNTGQTPAYNVKHITIFGVRKTIPDTLQIINQDFLKSSSVLGNGVFTYIHLKKTFSESQITAISNKTIYLTIIGTIKYLDIFKREQFLEFNLFYDVDRKTFIYCEEHNNAS
ncbi:MAG: hypothetical protein H8D45_03360, partial [Bacteroidetes bacterium]|nr:hypothetical protein [Bacteroidota bacterium]